MATSVYLGGGGGGTPATPTNSIQFNNAGAFGGSSNLEWNNSTNTLAVPAVSAVGTGNLSLESQEADVDASGFTPVLAGAGAGNVSNGTHRYKFSFSDQDTPGGHQTADSGAPTPAVAVTNNAVNGQVTVPIPANFLNIYPYINLYRDKNSDGVYKFVGSNEFSGAFTFTDNVADGSLGATMPTTNTTLEPRLVISGDRVMPFNSIGQGQQFNLGDGVNTQFWFATEAVPGSDGAEWYFRGSDANSAGNSGGEIFIESGAGYTADGTIVGRTGITIDGASANGTSGFIELLAANSKGPNAGAIGGLLHVGGASGPAGNGGAITLTAGNASSTGGNGGGLSLTSGNSTFSGSNPGEIDITAGHGTSGNVPGGIIQILAGDASGNGLGGSVNITAGGSGSGTPGDIVLTSTDFIKMTGPTLFPGNGSIAIGQTNGNSLILRAYDVDGATYKTFLTLTSANTPDLTIGPAAGATVTLQASTYKSSDGSTGATAGPFTTISSITVKNGLVTALTGS